MNTKDRYIPDYMPNAELDLIRWIGQFLNALEPYVPVFELAPQDVSKLQTTYQHVIGVVGNISHVPGISQALVEYKNQLLYARTYDPLPAPKAEQKIFPDTDAEMRGLVKYINDLSKTIKAHKAYTPEIGKQMGIVPSPKPPVDWTRVQPEITVEDMGDFINLYWRKAQADAIEIEVDRGTGWQLCTIGNHSPVVDAHPQPEQVSVWKYRARYRKHDKPVGLHSATVEAKVLKQ